MRRWRTSARNREALALRADVNILELLCDAPPANEIRGELGILYVRGPIDHHRSFGDSYERITEAFHELNDDDQVKAIVMLIDSPGGLVSGLNATVRALRKAKSKPVYSIADEMATSAALAISCIADHRIATPSAVVGSCGVISTMCSQARADERQGIDFVTITSGERKADGHPHMPIEQGAIDAESDRVDELAAQFYALVDDTIGLSPDYLRALEAGIFLGADAQEVGFVDEVLDVDDALEAISQRHGLAHLDTTAAPGMAETPEASMLTAKAQIASLTRKMAASTSKTERSSLASKINSLLAKLPARAETTKKWEKHESEEETTSDEDEEEGGNETDREEESDDKDEKKAESEDDEKKAASAESDDKKDDDDKDEKKESKKASARLAAVEGENQILRARLEKLEKTAATKTRTDTLAIALKEKRITPAEHTKLATKDATYIATFLDARPRSLVLTPEEALRPLPKGSAKVAAESGGAAEAAVELTPEMEEMLARIPDEKLRAQVLTNWKAQTNGVAR